MKWIFFVAAKKIVAGIQFCRSATSFGSDKFFNETPPPPVSLTFSRQQNNNETKFLFNLRTFLSLAHAQRDLMSPRRF